MKKANSSSSNLPSNVFVTKVHFRDDYNPNWEEEDYEDEYDYRYKGKYRTETHHHAAQETMRYVLLYFLRTKFKCS